MGDGEMLRPTVFLCAAVIMGLGFAQSAMAAKTVSINVDEHASAGNVNVDVNGVNATYVYTIYDGQAVNDTIPVDICMTGSESGWTSIDVSFGTQSNGITPPSDQTFLEANGPECHNLNIVIATGNLVLTDPNLAETFGADFSLQGKNPVPSGTSSKPQLSFADIKNFHIDVNVLPAVSTDNVSCFITDSEGNFLLNCAGAEVTQSGSDEGRFAIVANKKREIEVATNPGQFYYNLIWHNTTGATQTVDAAFARTGVVANGQQAIHAAVFNSYLDPLTPVEFAMANAEGIPQGNDDSVEGVEVPAGASLLLTYHLEWAGLGEPVPAPCAGNCAEADQKLSVTGTVSGEGITTEDCTAGAFGFRK